MRRVRVIARLDVKNEHVIKGIHLEGLRKVGVPNVLARRYFAGGADELIFMDAVAAYYDRNSLDDIIRQACDEVFIPITVGGGIRSIDDIHRALFVGADKVAINTQAIKTPSLINEAAKVFGSQCIVGSIDAKYNLGIWEAYTDNGREPTGLEVVDWAKELEELGAGEILLTSIDREGTKKGFDENLVTAVVDAVNIPVIACGGCGKPDDVARVIQTSECDAVAIAGLLHYDLSDIHTVKGILRDEGIEVRMS